MLTEALHHARARHHKFIQQSTKVVWVSDTRMPHDDLKESTLNILGELEMFHL